MESVDSDPSEFCNINALHNNQLLQFKFWLYILICCSEKGIFGVRKTWVQSQAPPIPS